MKSYILLSDTAVLQSKGQTPLHTPTGRPDTIPPAEDTVELIYEYDDGELLIR